MARRGRGTENRREEEKRGEEEVKREEEKKRIILVAIASLCVLFGPNSHSGKVNSYRVLQTTPRNRRL